MKKTSLTFLVALFAIVNFSGIASASFFESYANFYTTGASGSLTPKSVFTLNEKPWLYIEFNDSSTPAQGVNQTLGLWSQNSQHLFTDTGVSSGNHFWTSLDDSAWNAVKSVGDWSIYTISALNENKNSNNFDKFDPSNRFFYGHTHFDVTAAPEPVSTILFLTGGVAFAGNFLRRRRLLAV